MRGYLLDTNVISMRSPSRNEASEAFIEWLERVDADSMLFISVVSIDEIEKGIALLAHKGATAKAANLTRWLAGLVATYDDKIIPIDTATAAMAGKLEAKANAAGHDPGMAEATICGIAKTHDLVVMTRNTKHFRVFDFDVLSPDDTVR